ISFLLLAGSAVFLARLHFLLFRHSLLAVFAGVFFALLPVHGKPMYWIAAWHNTSVCFFALAALTFRIEQWRSPRRENLFRILSLVFLYFALASREVAFAVSPILILIDYKAR